MKLSALEHYMLLAVRRRLRRDRMLQSGYPAHALTRSLRSLLEKGLVRVDGGKRVRLSSAGWEVVRSREWKRETFEAINSPLTEYLRERLDPATVFIPIVNSKFFGGAKS